MRTLRSHETRAGVSSNQLAVAERDRIRALRMRALSFCGAAVLIAFALWGAGFPPMQWWRQLRAMVGAEQTQTVPIVEAAPPQAQAQQGLPTSTDGLGGTDSSLSKTAVPLVLVSASPGRNSREGTARIGTDVANPQTYSAGALLANGARLAEIYADRVVLIRGDEQAELLLHRIKPGVASAGSKRELLQVGGEDQKPPPIAQSRRQLTDYIRPTPVYDEDQLKGFRLQAGTRSGVFYRLGLQGDDLITSINSVPVADVVESLNLLQLLLDGQALQVTVERKGERRHISLDGSLMLDDQKDFAATNHMP